MASNKYVYKYGDLLYINLTNRCTNNCTFCIRTTPSGVDGIDLWLEKEPTAEEVCKQLEEHEFRNYPEVVFCGYGEPLLRYKELIETARYIKSNSDVKIRVNTNGHASKAAGYDIVPELAEVVDVISISLNAPTAKEYNEVCICEYGEDGFYAMLEFAKSANKLIPETVLSVVDTIDSDMITRSKQLADSLGIFLRVREYSE